jgi:hypothetical protein
MCLRIVSDTRPSSSSRKGEHQGILAFAKKVSLSSDILWTVFVHVPLSLPKIYWLITTRKDFWQRKEALHLSDIA